MMKNAYLYVEHFHVRVLISAYFIFMTSREKVNVLMLMYRTITVLIQN